MADAASLKRLGGGRWQSRDGRFTIEPQSGTWVVVDGERTDELGLPLIRGPFPSLTAARADIEIARTEGEVTSPLASRLAAAPRAKANAKPSRGASAKRVPAAEPAPREPAWIRSLDGPTREVARSLIARLTDEGVADAEALVRSDLVGGQPALARLAIARALEAVTPTRDRPDAAGRALTDVLLDGEDLSLGVSWRLVDGTGRPIRRLDRG